MDRRLQREQKTVEAMIKLYCKNNHKTREAPCGRCKVHCYKPEMREEIKNVMRTTGAKLMFRHPGMAFFHLVDAVRYK